MKNSDSIDVVEVTRTLLRLLPSIRNLVFEGRKNIDSPLPKGQMMVLMVLSLEGPQTMTYLHELIGIEKGSLTSVVDALVEKKYVARVADEKDRRKVIASITSKGGVIADEMKKTFYINIKERVSKLSKKDLLAMMNTSSVLKGLLDKM
jgi:MarR family transcriptional regulator, organic hydroperoxide resistance regulator